MPADRSAIRANAERFSRQRFMHEFQAAVGTLLAERGDGVTAGTTTGVLTR
jgi:hypothetical protein